MAIIIPNLCQVAASINADGTLEGGSGIASIANPGAGLYDISLEAPIGDAECAMFATIHQSGVNGQCVTSHTSNAVKRVETRVGGVLTNSRFDFLLVAFPTV